MAGAASWFCDNFRWKFTELMARLGGAVRITKISGSQDGGVGGGAEGAAGMEFPCVVSGVRGNGVWKVG